jgi:hypothetical protein
LRIKRGRTQLFQPELPQDIFLNLFEGHDAGQVAAGAFGVAIVEFDALQRVRRLDLPPIPIGVGQIDVVIKGVSIALFLKRC